MLNTTVFLSRLEEIMETHQLNAAGFAERIGVQRSSVSHILSKRNKPSLDFILKIKSAFSDVSFNWLLLDHENITPIPYSTTKDAITTRLDQSKLSIKDTIQVTNNTTEEVVQIIKLYQDGSFRIYSSKS